MTYKKESLSITSKYQTSAKELAECNALEKLVKADSINRCGFHYSKGVREDFNEKMKPYLVGRRETATDHDSIIVNHCYKACRILCYLPNLFAINYCDFLIESANCIMDDQLEVHLKEKIKNIRDRLVRDPKLSWFSALMETNSWCDTTSNKVLLVLI